MKLRSNKKITLLFLFCVGASAAQMDHKTAFSGTWKLNVAKSDFGGQPAPVGAVITNPLDGTMMVDVNFGDGKTAKWSHVWSGGAEVPYEGIAEGATAVAKIRGQKLEETIKIGGKIAETVHAVLSPDGKTMTSMIDRTKDDPMGEGHMVLLYEKQ